MLVVGKVAVRGEAATAHKLMEAVGDTDADVRAAGKESYYEQKSPT